MVLWKSNEYSSVLSCYPVPKALGLCSLPASCFLSLASRSIQTPISSPMFLQPRPPACLAAQTCQHNGLYPHILKSGITGSGSTHRHQALLRVLRKCPASVSPLHMLFPRQEGILQQHPTNFPTGNLAGQKYELIIF